MDTTETLGFWGSESEEVIARQYPLHKACRDGDVLALSRLVAQSTPHQLVAEDRFYGWTPLHWAAYFGKNQCLVGLLRTGVNVNIRTSRFHQTPSHISAFGGHPSCLLELLNAGADFHAKDYLGELPIHKAARVGNTQCVTTLIENGANPSIHNNNGHNAADLSRMQNFKECTNLLETAFRVLTEREKCDTIGDHEMMNGSSGSHLTNNHGNGFINGNGRHFNHSNGSKKRSFEDESIPNIKRPRTAEIIHNSVSPDFRSIPTNSQGSINFISKPKVIPQYEDEVFSTGEWPDVSAMKQITEWECHKGHERSKMASDYEDIDMSVTHWNSDVHDRAPSPGSDLKPNNDECDLQLWGYMQGYGDTAESMPDNYSVNNNGKDYCKSLHGVQFKGWS